MAKQAVSLLGLDRFLRKVGKLGRRYGRSKERAVLMKEMVVFMNGSIAKNFQNQGRPKKWKKLAKSTIKARRKGGKGAKILQDTGRLRMAATGAGSAYIQRPTAKGIEFGINLEYGATHQFGRKQGKGRIPARPFMLFQKDDVKILAEMLRDDYWEFDKKNRIRVRG